MRRQAESQAYPKVARLPYGNTLEAMNGRKRSLISRGEAGIVSQDTWKASTEVNSCPHFRSRYKQTENCN